MTGAVAEGGGNVIDSVNNNRGYYEYNRINTEMGKGMQNHEKFALGYDSTEKDSTKKDDKKSVKDRDGVVVEFSNQSKTQHDGIGSHQKNEASAEDAFDMGQTVAKARGFIGNLIQAVAELWIDFKQAIVAFWNSDGEAQKAKEAEEAIETADSMSDMVDTTGEEISEESAGDSAHVQEVIGTIERESTSGEPARVAKLPDSLDIEETVRQAEQLFATGRYVKNSDLLTYYDRRGKIVQLSGTDKNRILQGDSRGGRLI